LDASFLRSPSLESSLSRQKGHVCACMCVHVCECVFAWACMCTTFDERHAQRRSRMHTSLPATPSTPLTHFCTKPGAPNGGIAMTLEPDAIAAS
jgi:hypothetical protein